MSDIGDQIGRYRIVGPLGKGGMGVVYRAEDTRLQRPVALKFLPPDALDPESRVRLFNEARAAGRIRHPNVCPVYDVDEVDGQAFIALALLEGETLARTLSRGALEPGSAVHIAMQVLAGLQSAHVLGIVHRDIKPGNILIGPSSHVWILDFGLAIHPEMQRLTATGITTGTPAYMSPEQALGQDIDARSDIWSLGVVLFEMLSGATPVRAPNHMALMRAIVETDAPQLSSLRPDLPPRLSAAVEKALARDRTRRWPSSLEFEAELRAVSQELGLPAQVETQTMSVSRLGRKSVRAGVVAGVLVLAAGAGWWWQARRGPSEPAVIANLPPRGSARQIAVLPFQVTSGGDRVRIISDGITELLTESFADAGQGSARVMAVPSREIRRREIASPEEARRVYGVDFVLAGTAEENGSGVRFRIRLIDSAEARETGAATFDYQPSNPAAGRQRATAEAAKLLHLEVAAAADKAGAEPGASDAFAAYLEARGFMARFEVPGSGNLDKAIAAYERATERDPKFALAWAGLGEAWWRRSRAGGGKEAADKARSSAERGVQLGPNLAMTHAILGAVYSTAGKQEEATAELRKALRISPENADAARELARLLARAGRRKDAEASYLASIRSRPTDWYGYLLLGLFYYSGEQYQEAEAALKRAIKLAPANEIALRDLGGIYMVQGRYPEALEALQRSLKNHQASRTYMSLATTYFYMHRFREASTAGETAVDLDPSRHDHWGNLGIFYKWTPGSESRSEAALRKAVELAEKRLLGTPGDSSVYADLAEYRARLGDKAGSMAAIEKIPQAARQGVASRLAIAYELCGNRTQAVEFLRSTVKNAATLSLIRDDPDLAGLWADARFQQAIAAVLKSKA